MFDCCIQKSHDWALWAEVELSALLRLLILLEELLVWCRSIKAFLLRLLLHSELLMNLFFYWGESRRRSHDLLQGFIHNGEVLDL